MTLTTPAPETGREAELVELLADGEAAAAGLTLPTIIPFLLRSSGLYRYPTGPVIVDPIPGGVSSPLPGFPWLREDLRLDVDGRYPQMAVSGTLTLWLPLRLHWVASLSPTGPNEWSGPIWYKDGVGGLLPHTNVRIVSHPTLFQIGQTVTATFTGGSLAPRTRTYRYVSRYFHPVEFEYDATPDAHPVTQIATCDHPNRPATLPCETLSLDTAYRRAGFNVTNSGGDSIVPLADAGADQAWSDAEMHDAMQLYWSRFANAPQWSLWVFFAALSDRGTGLGGIMFDDIGPNHRQGTAIFTDTFIADPPAGDTNPAAWVRRMRFWTAAHEMGHAFNLAHAWQKAMGTPWIPLANDPESRSFMNYPFRVTGGQAAFFADFEFRFSDQELLFLRHAPERFVQMGNADWFDHHGFEQALTSPEPGLTLALRASRERPTFEFLEPVILELKLTNTTASPMLVDEHVLSPDNLTVITKKDGRPARQWAPYSRLYHQAKPIVLEPGKATYAPLRLFAGTNGWDVCEPGRYEIQVALHLDDEDVVSAKLHLRIAAPQSFTEEDLATDLFSEEVGRTLVFGGTEVLTAANTTLHDVAERLPERRVAVHAQLALAQPLARGYRTLEIPDTHLPMTAVHAAGGMLRSRPAKPDEAAAGLQKALTADPGRAAETLGNITYKRRVDSMSAFLAEAGAPATAAASQQAMLAVFEERGVLTSVRANVAEQQQAYATAAKDAASQRRQRKS